MHMLHANSTALLCKAVLFKPWTMNDTDSDTIVMFVFDVSHANAARVKVSTESKLDVEIKR